MCAFIRYLDNCGKTDGELITIQDKHKLKQFMNTKPVLNKILKEILPQMMETVTITRAGERINFMKGRDGQMRNIKETHMFNSVNQETPKMSKGERK
jgi:hypothetical protein